MKSKSRNLYEKSVQATLAAIELYNKPNFLYREESFTILAVNAWELLLKARVLQLSSNNLSSITKYKAPNTKSGKPSKRKQKVKNRAGNHQTISLFHAYDRLINEYGEQLDKTIRSNLEAIVEIRDNAIHLFNKDPQIEHRILEVGTATLSNYIQICRRWFGDDLSQYNIFLMPLAFARPDKPVTGLILNSEERKVAAYLQSIEDLNKSEEDSDFSTSLKIEFSLKRTKSDTAIKYALSNDPNATPLKLEESDLRERYPWGYENLNAQLKKRFQHQFKMNHAYHKFRKKLESNPRYCKVRLLDPGNPKSSKKKFYNTNIIKEFEKLYKN